jgi:hypothetical protein
MSPLLTLLAGCIPGYDPEALEAVCLRVEVTPEADSLPAVPGASTEVGLAVCGCEAPAPCPDDALIPGRILAVSAELGVLDAESAYLLDGRGQVTFWADGSTGLGSVAARTVEGFSGAATVALEAPLTLGFDRVDLYPGEPVFVPVSGAVPPLEAPEVSSGARIEAAWDEPTGLLVLSTGDLLPRVTTGVVSVRDAAGQEATLTVFVQPGTPRPESVGLEAARASLPADGSSTTLITVSADVPDGTPASLFTTVGGFAQSEVALFGGSATALYVAGYDVGTATLLATVGHTTSAPLELELTPPE